METNKTTRRGYLGLLGGAVAGSLAGCSGSDAATAPAQSNGSDGESDTSPYAEVYEETIDSVVLIQTATTGGRGGQGSGFVYQNGYVVTNAHVVADTTDVTVRFARGSRTDATVVGTEPSSDLAVLRVPESPDYATPLETTEQPPEVGSEVVAIGSPYGLEGSITSGLVSGVNRSIPAPNGYTIPDAIQTSAPVNPGNSGGPLVDLDGRVVGVINSGGGENLGFAISSALVERVVPAVIQTGDFEFPYLGVRLGGVTPDVAERLGLDQARGLLVAGVKDGGPADGTLQQGDVLTQVAGRQLRDRQALSSYLALEAAPGDTVEFTLVRDGQEQTVTVTLGTRPERTGSPTPQSPSRR
jgi:S1-C subfamily serine protease